MLQPLEHDLCALSNTALEDEIATLAAHIAAAEYCFLVLVAELDRRKVWAVHGLRRAAHWLAWRCGVGLGVAFAEGRLSYSKVRALTRIAAPHNEEWLLALALNGTAIHVERVVRMARRHGEDMAIELAQRPKSSGASCGAGIRTAASSSRGGCLPTSARWS